MAGLRVHELTKELGITSEELLTYPKDRGELVKASSSAPEPPIVRSVRERYSSKGTGEEQDPAARTLASKKPSAPKTSTAKPRDKSTQSSAKARTPASVPVPADLRAAASAGPAFSSTPKPGATPTTPKPGATSVASKPGAAPRPDVAPRPATAPKLGAAPEPAASPKIPAPRAKTTGHDGAPAAPRPGIPRPVDPRPGPRPAGPRPGNNPYTSSQGIPRPGGTGDPRPDPRQGDPHPGQGGSKRPARGGAPRPRGSGSPRPDGAPRPGGRSGSNHPNPGMMPGQVNFAHSATTGTNDRSIRGSAGDRGRGTRPEAGGGTGTPAGGGFGPTRGSGRGGRSATPDTFGHGSGRNQRDRKSRHAERQEFEQQSAPIIGGVSIPRGNGQVVRIRQGASLADLAKKIDVNPAALVTILFHLGEVAATTQSLDQGTFKALGAELGYGVKVVSPGDEDRELLESFDIDLETEELDDAGHMQPRPPVVTVMGHVGRDKTKLLDAIRHTDIVGTKHGGITRHIGTYQVNVRHEGKTHPITFIDTPGREAFIMMCARSAQVTDTVTLMAAADDGVIPRTVETINHAQAANVPIAVAVNRVDKGGASPDKICGQLTEYGLVTEGYGNDVMFVSIPTKGCIGIRELLEAVLLTADAVPTFGANPDTAVRGIAIEASLDKGRGAVAIMLIERGISRIGDAIVVGSVHGRVRTMFGDTGADVTEARPSRPVAVLGLTSIPRAGDSFLVATDERTIHQIADKHEAAEQRVMLAERCRRVSLGDFNKVLKEDEVDTFNLIIKGDVFDAVGVLEDPLPGIDVGEEIQLHIIHHDVGTVTQDDVNLVTVDNAVIIGFNVHPAERVVELADAEGIEIKYYSVIYPAIEDIETALKSMLELTYEKIFLDTAEIRQIFHSDKFGNITGSIARSGAIKRGTKAHLVRDGVAVAGSLEIRSPRREKDDVTEVREGCGCGTTLGFKDITEGDLTETWAMHEKPRD